MCDRQDQSIALHHIKLNLEMKNITIEGQIIAKTDDNGMLKYNKYEDIDEQVQDLMTKWLKKKLVTTIVRSREKGMKRRCSNEEITTSSQEETTDKQKFKMSFNSKDSKRYFFTKNEECMTNKETHIAAADKKRKRKSGSKEVDVSQERTIRNLKEEDVEGSGSSMNSPPKEKEERQETTISTVLQKNTRSMSSSQRLEELFSEVYRVRWDVILISETWRQGKEIWETAQGHIVIESGKFTSKHGVASILNRWWKNQINWVESVCERVVAVWISVNKQPITLVSVYLPHSGYPDHHVEKEHTKRSAR